MLKAKGDGININLARWKGTGPPILALHGITANCMCWGVVADSLTPAFDFYAMDLRGRGNSDKPASGYSMEHHVSDIVNVLDDLGIDKVNLMGHSLGAFITLVFAAEHPDRVERAVLVDGAGVLSPEQMDEVFKGIKPALDRLTTTFSDEAAYLAKMRSAPYIQPWNDTIEAYYRYEVEACPDGVKTNMSVDHIAEESDNVRKVNCADYYAKVQCETLILRATRGLMSEKDILLPPDVIDNMMKAIPSVIQFDVDDTNHYGIVFQPHAGRDKALIDFLTP